MNKRRRFMAAMPAVIGLGLLGSRMANAQAAKVAETDPTAVALGYKEDAGKVDKKKYANYKAGDTCANCQLFAGKPTDAWAPCSAFGGKQVAGKGWCAAHVLKR
ncbi:MAG: high-potential iron-sulfur protein [Rhodocyclaceae bacterium]